MVSSSMKTGLLILFAAYFFDICQAQASCTTDGWFGTNCQYQCHCAGSTPCDKVDGSCSSGCHQDWFGPACQYDRMGFNGPGRLTDNDKNTCFTERTTTVTLNTRIPLTWIRVVVNNTAGLNQIQLNYHLTGSSPALACSDLRTAKVNDVTLDISCSTVDTVRRVTLTVPDGTGLCSLDISGGRNVALKQTVQQSSRFIPQEAPDSYRARYAVDGILPSSPTTRASARSTCTHTDPGSGLGWWTVTFSQTVDVTRFLVYNRDDDCCRERLENFQLTARPESSSTDAPYSYTGPDSAQATYTVVPSPKVSFPVKEVRFDSRHSTKMLTLCEVFVFGETDCPAGRFGLGCERQCNCANQGSCFVHSGGCPSGCAPGYTGADCSECLAGKYGGQCELPCSDTCGGDNSCDRNDGACSQGCDPGYRGMQCKTKCPAGWYGAGCLSPCSSNCAGSGNACHHVSGFCDEGCDPRHWGQRCWNLCNVNCAGPDNACARIGGNCTSCNPGRYGPKCSLRCNSSCAGQGNACDRDSGACTEGCDPGHYGVTCSSPCSSNCGRPDNACDRDSGACDEGCDPGYKEPKCDQKCDFGSYGEGCQETCEHCAGDQNSCDHVSGTCDLGCDPGYQGSLCKQKCGANTWGQDCKETCNIGCTNSNCDHMTGQCDCSPGFGGFFCDQECPAGRYDRDCEMTCSVHCAGPDHACDSVDGSCDQGCEPGYQGRFCSDACPMGSYGLGCNQTCSVQCAGQDRPCHHVDGACYLGCVQDDQSPMCRSALAQRDESGGSGLITWGVAATVVAVVAIVALIVVIGVLVRRQRSAASANNDLKRGMEAGSLGGGDHRPAQQGMTGNVRPDPHYEPMGTGPQRGDPVGITQTPIQHGPAGNIRPNHHYDPTETGPEYVHVYDTGFDHYDSPQDLMAESGGYETPRPLPRRPSDQDVTETEQTSTATEKVDGAPYNNIDVEA